MQVRLIQSFLWRRIHRGVLTGLICQNYYATTVPCPDVYFVNALQQTIKCVNKGATAIFNMIPDPDPAISGILKGTTWVINWGDGTIYNYTSTADNDIPSLANRTHTYTSVLQIVTMFSPAVLKTHAAKHSAPSMLLLFMVVIRLLMAMVFYKL